MNITKKANLELVPWLIGNWKGKNGKLRIPNNKTKDYQGNLEVNQLTSSHPILHLKYKSMFKMIN